MRQNTIKFNDKITVISFLLSIGVVYQHTQWNYIGGGMRKRHISSYFLL